MNLLRQFHLIVAAISGIFLVLICISGALLVYGKEIQHLISPNYWLVEVKSKPKRLSDLISNVEKTTRSHVKQIRIEEDDEIAWQLILQNGSWVSINQYTNDILYQYEFDKTFYGFVMFLHRWLIYTDKDGNRPFKVFISIASLLLIIEVILGLWLWLKPKKPFKRLKLRKNAPNRTKWYQRHILFGVISALPLILLAFSGMTFHWKQATQKVIEVATMSNIEAPSKPYINSKPINVDLDVLLEKAKTTLAGGRIARIYLPTTDAMFSVRVQLPLEHYPYSWRWFNANTAQLIDKYDAVNQSSASWLWNFRYVFHVGSFGGHFTKVLWLLLSLLPIFFLATGFYFYIQKKRK